MPSIRRRGVETVEDGLDTISDDLVEPESMVIVNSATPGVAAPSPGEADLLSAPVGMDDDLAHALAARPPRRKLPGVTAFLGAAVLVAGGFLGGVLTQKHEGGTSTGGATNAAALAAAFGNRAGTGTGTGAGAAAGGTGAAAGGSATTVGTVKLVDGNTIYLTATDGSIIRVTTGSGTTIKVTKNGVASDLAPGTTVVVAGTADSSGVVKATTVTEGGGFAGGGFPGRNRTGTGTGTTTGGTSSG